MNFKYLGTGSCEGIPAVFCDCDACKSAIKSGGKNLRTRSQALINDDLLIDFGMDTAIHAVKYKINLAKMENVLVTHSHFDHFFPQEFLNRAARLSHSVENKVINIYGSQGVKDAFFKILQGEIDDKTLSTIKINVINPFTPYKIGNYNVVALEAKHMKTEQALLYIVSDGEKSVLYGNDTGAFSENNYEYLLHNNIKLDLVSLDCGEALNNVGSYGHMNLVDCSKVKQRLINNNNISKDCKFYLTHISHNSGGNHQQITSQASPYSLFVAYDGLNLII